VTLQHQEKTILKHQGMETILVIIITKTTSGKINTFNNQKGRSIDLKETSEDNQTSKRRRVC